MSSSQDTTNPSRRTMLAGIPAAALGVAPPCLAATIIGPDAVLIALGDEYDQARRDIAAYLESIGHADVKDDYVFPDDEVSDRMVDVRAVTIVGLVVKAKACFHASAECDKESWLEEPSGAASADTRILFSLLRDILALSA